MSKSRIGGLAVCDHRSRPVRQLYCPRHYYRSPGHLVSGATITLTDPARNFTRTQQTNADGAYIFTAIPPGTYKLDVSAPGFKTASASGLVALVDTPTVRDIQLEIGAVSETVDVTSAAEAAINTSDASLGNSFERRRIVELPLNANNVVGLLSLQLRPDARVVHPKR